MKIKKIIIGLLFLSVFGVGLGYFFDKNHKFGLCYWNDETAVYDISCSNFYSSIGEPLVPGMSALAVVFFALLLIPSAFNAWKKFAVWAIPIALFIFIMTQSSNTGGIGGSVGFGPTDLEMYRWVSILFVLISLVIIGWVGFLKNRK